MIAQREGQIRVEKDAVCMDKDGKREERRDGRVVRGGIQEEGGREGCLRKVLTKEGSDEHTKRGMRERRGRRRTAG